MPRTRLLLAAAAAIWTSLSLGFAQAQQVEKRIALVIGNQAYQATTPSTAANDAGLVAQTLQAAGFDVVGARDLDAVNLRSALREFVEKARASGPNGVALVYFAGEGLQFEGQNYIAPVDAQIARSSDVPLAAVRVSDLTGPLAAIPLKARMVILDAARVNRFGAADQPLAGGLALMQPDPGSLIAFNAAPGTIAPEAKGDYGAYATALSEMIKQGGLPLDELFERVRLRVNDLTSGGEVTWNASRIDAPFVFLERTAAAPPAQPDRFAELATRPIHSFDAHDAYLAALARDTLPGYLDFLAAFPTDPLTGRVRAIVAARREATTWRESALADIPDAYWSYLHRYPRGPHAPDARRRLTHFAVALAPPPSFTEIVYDVPPPPEDEIIYVARPVVFFADPVYDFPPPPPVPVIFLPPRPVYFVDLPPPPPPLVAFVLPFPTYYPVPAWVSPPAYVAPPPINVVNVNIHNTIVVDPASQSLTVTNPAGQRVAPLPNAGGLIPPSQAAPGGVAGAIAAHPLASAAVAAAVALPAAMALHPKQQGSGGQNLPGVHPLQSPSARPAPAPLTPATPSIASSPLRGPTANVAPPGRDPSVAVPAQRPDALVAPPVKGAPHLPPATPATAGPTPLVAARKGRPSPIVAPPSEVDRAAPARLAAPSAPAASIAMPRAAVPSAAPAKPTIRPMPTRVQQQQQIERNQQAAQQRAMQAAQQRQRQDSAQAAERRTAQGAQQAQQRAAQAAAEQRASQQLAAKRVQDAARQRPAPQRAPRVEARPSPPKRVDCGRQGGSCR